MKNNSILITGGTGFIGSNFIPYFLEKYDKYNIINLDLLTYAGNLENLKEVKNHPRYKFIKGNICNHELVEYIFNKFDIKGVIHFAAGSHVDNSIKKPDIFIKTNVNGTFTLLDIAKNYWLKEPFQYKNRYTINHEPSTYKSLITFVKDRAGHDRRYAIDAIKIEKELGWKAEENFESGIIKTIRWYLKQYGKIYEKKDNKISD